MCVCLIVSVGVNEAFVVSGYELFSELNSTVSRERGVSWSAGSLVKDT